MYASERPAGAYCDLIWRAVCEGPLVFARSCLSAALLIMSLAARLMQQLIAAPSATCNSMCTWQCFTVLRVYGSFRAERLVLQQYIKVHHSKSVWARRKESNKVKSKEKEHKKNNSSYKFIMIQIIMLKRKQKSTYRQIKMCESLYLLGHSLWNLQAGIYLQKMSLHSIGWGLSYVHVSISVMSL